MSDDVKPAHAEGGPSKATQLMLCPGSIQKSRGLPNPSTAASDRGTRLHSFLEVCLIAKRSPFDFPVDGEWAVYSAEERADVFAVYEYVRNLLIDYPGELATELRLDLGHYWAGMFGALDVVIVYGRTVFVIDAKFGRHPVPATTPQLKIYGLGVLRLYDYLEFDEVTCVVAQPAIGRFEDVTYTPAELETWARTEWVPALELAFGPNPPVNPSPEACKFCPARAICVERKAADFDGVAAALDAAPIAGLLTPAEVGTLLKNVDRFESYLGDLKEYAMRELVAGREIPGQKLVEGRAVRKWVGETVMAELARAFLERNPEGDLVEATRAVSVTTPITITAAEKLLGKKNPVFATLTTKPQGQPSLAPESDPRPPFIPNADVLDALDNVEI